MIFKLFFFFLLPLLLLSAPFSIPQLITINNENVRLSKNCDLSLLDHINSFSFTNGKISFNTTPLPTFEAFFLNVFNFFCDELPKTSYLDLKPALKKFSFLNATTYNENMGTWQTALTMINILLKRCKKNINNELKFFWKMWKLEEIVAKPKNKELMSYSFEYGLDSDLQQNPPKKFLNLLKLVLTEFNFLLTIDLMPSSEKYPDFDGVLNKENPIGPQGYKFIFNNYAKKIEFHFVEFSIKIKLKGTLFLYFCNEKGHLLNNFKWEKIDTNDSFEVLNFKLHDKKLRIIDGRSFMVDYKGKGAFMLREGDDDRLNDNIRLQKRYINRNYANKWKNTDIFVGKKSVAINMTLEIIQ